MPGLRRQRPRSRLDIVVATVAVATILLRIPYLWVPLSPDESGFLQVARTWHRGGGQLYGPYFVDRPPLLLELFRLAGVFGGIFGWRLLGTSAAAVTVVCVGLAVRRVAGVSASRWASLVAGALMVSPLLGTAVPNGELVAAPFVAGGFLAALTMIDSVSGRRVGAGIALGVCALAAVMVKQNMFDVLAFVLALGAALHRRPSGARGITRMDLLVAVGGVVFAGGVILGIAAALGTGPGGVFYAMYPFRLRAASVLSQFRFDQRLTRLGELAATEVLTLGPAVLVLMVVGLTRHRVRMSDRRVNACAVAISSVAAYDLVSIASGGSYWHHYLVQLIVPTAFAAGLVIPRLGKSGRALATAIATISVLAWCSGLCMSVPAAGQTVGSSIGAVARPGDTIVSALGDADIVQAAGLSSPYPYLWSLPARTLDPRQAQMADLLAGRRAPTWFVVRGRQTRALLAAHGVGRVLDRRYERVTDVCGRLIYLRRGLERSTPRPLGRAADQSGCRSPMVPWDAEAP